MSQRLVGDIRLPTEAGRDDDRFLSPELQHADMERWATAKYADVEWVSCGVEIDRTGTDARVGVLRAAGFRLEPTGRNPGHFTVRFDDLEVGIEELRGCEHRSWVNPYHED